MHPSRAAPGEARLKPLGIATDLRTPLYFKGLQSHLKPDGLTNPFLITSFLSSYIDALTQ